MVSDVITKTDEGWRLDRKISISAIVGILGMFIAVLSWTFALSERITVAENTMSSHQEVDEIQHEGFQLQIEAIKEAEANEAMRQVQMQTEIIRRLERIEDGTNRNTAAMNRHIETSGGK